MPQPSLTIALNLPLPALAPGTATGRPGVALPEAEAAPFDLLADLPEAEVPPDAAMIAPLAPPIVALPAPATDLTQTAVPGFVEGADARVAGAPGERVAFDTPAPNGPRLAGSPEPQPLGVKTGPGPEPAEIVSEMASRREPWPGPAAPAALSVGPGDGARAGPGAVAIRATEEARSGTVSTPLKTPAPATPPKTLSPSRPETDPVPAAGIAPGPVQADRGGAEVAGGDAGPAAPQGTGGTTREGTTEAAALPTRPVLAEPGRPAPAAIQPDAAEYPRGAPSSVAAFAQLVERSGNPAATDMPRVPVTSGKTSAPPPAPDPAPRHAEPQTAEDVSMAARTPPDRDADSKAPDPETAPAPRSRAETAERRTEPVPIDPGPAPEAGDAAGSARPDTPPPAAKVPEETGMQDRAPLPPAEPAAPLAAGAGASSPPSPLHGPVAADPRPAAAAPLPEAVPAQIIRATAESGAPVTEIRLSPEELGGLRIELRTEGDRAFVTLSAERGETLDLLRRHADRLAGEFRAAGFSQLDLGFGQWTGTDRGFAGSDRPALPMPSDAPPEPAEPARYGAPAPTADRPANGLYMRI